MPTTRRQVTAGSGAGSRSVRRLAAPAARRNRSAAGGAGRLLSRRVTFTVLGIALVALLLRLAMVARVLTDVDRLFVPDDAYYTLAIARSLAQGLGPSADGGMTLTTGFQPLLGFLTVPVYWFTDDAGVPLRAVLVLVSVADAVSVVLLARIAARVAGPVAAVVAAGVWAVSPYALAVSLDGLESSLALALSLGLVEVWCVARERSGLRLWVAAGVLAGLALLARVDTVFLVALLGLVEVASRRFRSLLVAGGTALLVVLPWWAYSIALTGSPVPESGPAIQELVTIHRGAGLEVADGAGLAVGRVVGAPAVDLPAVRDALLGDPALATAATAALCAAIAAAAAWAGTRRRSGILQLPLLALGLHAVALLLFYGLVNSTPWFYERYLVPVAAVLGIALAAVVGLLWSAAHAGRPRLEGLGRRVLAGVAVVGGLGVVGVPAVESVRLLRLQPAGTLDAGYEGAKGYAEVAQQVLGQLPAGAVVGSLQSGALSYFAPYAPQGVQVVNLDGVVDGRAARALAERRVADYMYERGVTHVADWPFNYVVLRDRSAAAEVGAVELEPVGWTRPQGRERFEISRVRYPGAG